MGANADGWKAWVTGAALLAASPAFAQGASIYTCTDDRGRKLTSDRPIAECAGKEQRVLNRDGSLREIKPPTLTAEERAEVEARERRLAEQRMAQAEAVRRDRNLMARYPNEAAHQKAREAALENVALAIRTSEARLKELDRERKPLIDEAEFYRGKTLPAKLRAQLDANDVALEAQRNAMANQSAELGRVNRIYDVELERLKKLWAGARPGSLGPMAAVAAAAPASAGSTR
jgi:Domain of unknown function (DUF4124)